MNSINGNQEIYKNNIISFIIHVVLNITGFITAKNFVGQGTINIWHVTIYLILIILYPLISYLLAGHLLHVFDTLKKRLLSTISVSIILAIVWIFCFVSDNGSLLSDIVWVFFLYANNVFYPLFSLVESLHFPTSIVTLPVVFLPSVLIWLGMEIKHIAMSASFLR